jgi:hypothetical protein
VGTEETETDEAEFETRMRELTAQLSEQMREGDRLNLLIQNNLAALGFNFS